MKRVTSYLSLSFAVVALLALFAGIPKASATSTMYANDCSSCHGTTPTTCGGCHAHGVHSSSAKSGINLTGTTNKTSYAPGETVSVTIGGGYRSGWVRAILYDQNMVQKAISAGPTGEGGGASFPITLSAPAPTTAGTYTWNVSWYGNANDTGSATFGTRWTPDANNPDHGEEIVSTNAFTVATAVPSVKIGVFSNGTWFLDGNANGAWNGSTTDRQQVFGFTGAIPVLGDWNGSGISKIGVFNKGTWYLDVNANGTWDGAPSDRNIIFGGGIAGAVPVTGDWTGTGTTKVGVFADGKWYLDLNGNGAWDGETIDGLYTFGDRLTGAVPVTGDWTGNGTTKIGVYVDGIWYLDFNDSKVWDGSSVDRQYFFGFNGALPVTGDWNADGKTEIGTFNIGVWYLDLNGNGAWNGTPTDVTYNFGTGIPVAGKW